MTRVVMFTIAVSIICGVAGICAYWGDEPPILPIIALGIVLTVLIVYFIILGMSYRSVLSRRKDDWSKIYFNAPPGFSGKGCAA